MPCTLIYRTGTTRASEHRIESIYTHILYLIQSLLRNYKKHSLAAKGGGVNTATHRGPAMHDGGYNQLRECVFLLLYLEIVR